MNRIKKQLFLAAMVLFLAACGQRGPLYLPEPEPEPVKTNDSGDDHEKTSGT